MLVFVPDRPWVLDIQPGGVGTPRGLQRRVHPCHDQPGGAAGTGGADGLGDLQAAPRQQSAHHSRQTHTIGNNDQKGRADHPDPACESSR